LLVRFQHFPEKEKQRFAFHVESRTNCGKPNVSSLQLIPIFKPLIIICLLYPKIRLFFCRSEDMDVYFIQSLWFVVSRHLVFLKEELYIRHAILFRFNFSSLFYFKICKVWFICNVHGALSRLKLPRLTCRNIIKLINWVFLFYTSSTKLVTLRLTAHYEIKFRY
jgi:hypothetical protein